MRACVVHAYDSAVRVRNVSACVRRGDAYACAQNDRVQWLRRRRASAASGVSTTTAGVGTGMRSERRGSSLTDLRPPEGDR